MPTLAEQLGSSPEFVDWSSPVNWGHPLNRGLASWLLAVPNRMGWGSFTFRDMLMRFSGTLTNLTPSSAWKGVAGCFGGVRLDGVAGHVVSFGSLSPLNTTDPRPCSVVVRFRAATDSITRHSFFSNCDSNNTTFYTDILRVSGSTWQQRLYSNGGYTVSSNYTLSTTDPFTYGYTWTSASNAVAFYLNGNANGTGTRAVGGTTTQGGTFGALRHTGTDVGFLVDGDLIELAIYNRILSDAEMLAVHLEMKYGHPNTLNRIPLPMIAPAAAAATRFAGIIGGGISMGELVCAPEHGG